MASIRAEWLKELAGTVVCIASGPSLTAEDCELVRASGLPTIVTNTTYQLCPWATVLLAFDENWWKVHHAQVAKDFKGRRVTCSNNGAKYGALSLRTLRLMSFKPFGNSGAAAVSLAALAGAKKVILLGYDCQHTAGRTHWHGDHPAPLGNAGSVGKWPKQFAQVAMYAKGRRCQVVNASRSTALTCFARSTLEEALALAVPQEMAAA
jgi:hypothetical protein